MITRINNNSSTNFQTLKIYLSISLGFGKHKILLHLDSKAFIVDIKDQMPSTFYVVGTKFAKHFFNPLDGKDVTWLTLELILEHV